MQTIKHLLGDACFVYFLFSAYDMQPVSNVPRPADSWCAINNI